MAPKVKLKRKLHFLTVGPNDKMIRSMIHREGHTCSPRPETNPDCAIFTGGEDVTPWFYGEKRLPTTVINIQRDLDEVEAFRHFDPFFPKIGICRGAQFLNVMSGGKLWQDVNNHGGDHDIVEEKTGRIVKTTSTHHQMMIPAPNKTGVVIAKAGRSTVKRSEKKTITIQSPEKEMDDPEIIYYWNTNSLCVQGHPEYPGCSEFTDYFWNLVYETIIPEKKVENAETVQEVSS